MNKLKISHLFKIIKLSVLQVNLIKCKVNVFITLKYLKIMEIIKFLLIVTNDILNMKNMKNIFIRLKSQQNEFIAFTLS
jgi:hypothetical protein